MNKRNGILVQAFSKVSLILEVSRPSIEGVSPYSKHSVSCIRSDQRLVESHAHHPKGYPPFLERAP